MILRILSHIYAAGIMTIIVTVILTPLSPLLYLLISFMAWDFVSFDLSVFLGWFRLSFVIGVIMGIWFAFDKPGQEAAKEFRENYMKGKV